MAYSDNFPTQRAVFTLDASNAGRLDPRCSFSRASTGSYFGTDKHLSSDNLLTYSENFGQWSQAGLVSRTGGQTDPAGGSTAFTITENSSSGYHRNHVNVKADESFAFVVYAKQNSGTRYLCLTLLDTNNDYELAIFDLAGGTPTTVSGSSSGFTNVSATQTASGNGFYKCVLKATGYTNTANVSIHNSTTSAGINTTVGLPSYTGDGSSIDVAFASLSSTGATDYNVTDGQIHRKYAPTLQTAAINAPRFEYSPTDSASMGLLIEGSSTNLVSYSESFSNQTVNDCTLTEGAAVGPDATLSANLLVPTTTANLLRNVNLDDGNSFSHTSGNNYAYSIFAKAAGYNYVQWVGLGYFGYTYCNFDLSGGTVGNKSGSVTGSVESVGNGWYRLTVIAPATVTNSSASKGVWAVVTSSTAARNEQFTGDGYSGVLLTMAQCELSSFSSSYIKSDSGAVSGTTRAADSAAIAVSDLGLTSGQDVSIITEANWGDPTDNPYGRFALALATDGNNRIAFYNNNGQNGSGWVRYSGSDSAFFNPGTTSGGYAKLGISAAMNSFNYAFNGTAGTEDTAGVVPEYTELEIGSNGIGTQQLDGHIKRVAVYGQSLSSTELAAVTS